MWDAKCDALKYLSSQLNCDRNAIQEKDKYQIALMFSTIFNQHHSTKKKNLTFFCVSASLAFHLFKYDHTVHLCAPYPPS